MDGEYNTDEDSVASVGQVGTDTALQNKENECPVAPI